MKDTTQRQIDMGDGQGLCQTQNERANQLSTGSLIFAASKDDVIVIEPDIEVLNTAAGATVTGMRAEEFESHWGLSVSKAML